MDERVLREWLERVRRGSLGRREFTRGLLALHGWMPTPHRRLPFPSVVVASRNDPLSRFSSAEALAHSWGSRLVDAGDVGHLDVASGFGPWPRVHALIDSLILCKFLRGTLVDFFGESAEMLAAAAIRRSPSGSSSSSAARSWPVRWPPPPAPRWSSAASRCPPASRTSWWPAPRSRAASCSGESAGIVIPCRRGRRARPRPPWTPRRRRSPRR